MSTATALKIGFTVAGGLLNLRGSRTSARGYRKTGDLAVERGEEQDVYHRIAAQQTEARGQMAAFEEERLARLTASRAIAVAAAGGSVDDILPLLADIEGEGAYRASIAMFEAEMEANRLRFEGEQARKYGEDQRDLYYAQAKAERKRGIGSGLGSLGGLF